MESRLGEIVIRLIRITYTEYKNIEEYIDD